MDRQDAEAERSSLAPFTHAREYPVSNVTLYQRTFVRSVTECQHQLLGLRGSHGSLGIVITFLVAVAQYLANSRLRKERFTFAPSLRGQHSSRWGRHGGRNVRHLVTLSLLSQSSTEM